MKLILVAFGLFTCGLLVYGLILYSLAKEKINDAPREDMFLCERHGPIAKKYVLNLEGILAEAPLEYCPICYSEKLQGKK